jgi:hypothetical protein
LPKNPLDSTAAKLNTKNQNEPDAHERREHMRGSVPVNQAQLTLARPSHRTAKASQASDDVFAGWCMRHPEKNIETVAACPRLLNKG